jgi:hypothetical protein
MSRNAALAIAILLSALFCGHATDVAPKRTGRFSKSITVMQAQQIIGKTRLSGQRCGRMIWNGEPWARYVNAYKPMKLPWYGDTLQPGVEATFAYGRGETHLISFSGPGFKYRRTTNSPVLDYEQPADETK